MNKYFKIGLVSFLSFGVLSNVQSPFPQNGEIPAFSPIELVAAAEQPSIVYSTHIQSYGWQEETKDGDTSGSTGLAKRLEGIKINIQNFELSGSVEYRTHVEKYGWMNWQKDGVLSGTEGESKRLEAIEIRLTGELAENYDVYYRVHAQKFGWLDWAKNGEPAGTAGYAYRLEAIEVRLVEKNGPSLSEGNLAFKQYIKEPSVSYQTHVQSIGWQNYVMDGQMSGTEGLAKRLEGIRIKLSNLPYSGDITYRTHVEKYGWLNWISNNALSGTTGESKRLEAIEINLNGELAKHYDVYYRVHAQSFGWMDWAKNGEPAGTAGYAKRLEGIEIRLVKKGETAPGSTTLPYKDKYAVIEKRTITVKENEVIFKKLEENTNELAIGESKISQAGSNGFDTVTYEVTYTNGKETSKTEISRVKTPATDQITQVGTRIDVAGIEIIEPSETVSVGDTVQLVATVTPQDATNKQLTWSSSNNEIAYIDDQNRLIAVGEGVVTVTAESADGLVSDELEVLVRPVKVEKITLSEESLILEEGQTQTITAVVAPENATYKDLIWTSSDENVVSVDEFGKITAVKAGIAVVSVADVTGEVISTVSIEIKEPTIVNISNLRKNIYQYDEFVLPTSVQAEMSNGVIKAVPITWNNDVVDSAIIGTKFYDGTVEGYEGTVTLTLIINEYDPKLVTDAYSMITINNLSQALALRMTNNGEKTVTINKIEIYESGKLMTTYTPDKLISSGIPTEVLPHKSWGMSITYKLGMWLDGSYVKFYTSANNTNYEYQNSLERTW